MKMGDENNTIILDRVDDKILKLLREYESLNLNQLWLKTFSREGQTAWKNRLNRLEELNLIVVDKKPTNNGLAYTITLKE
jgi:hypothetical protein